MTIKYPPKNKYKYNCAEGCHGPKDYELPMKPFFLEIPFFGLGQTNWADKLWDIWGIIFSQHISTHFGTVSLLSIFSIIQPFFLQTTKPCDWNWDWNLGCKVE